LARLQLAHVHAAVAAVAKFRAIADSRMSTSRVASQVRKKGPG
jgi:hypothetical protein